MLIESVQASEKPSQRFYLTQLCHTTPHGYNKSETINWVTVEYHDTAPVPKLA